MITFMAACIIGACSGSGELPRLAAAEGVTVMSESSRVATPRSSRASVDVVTKVEVVSIDDQMANQSQVPVTFGQVFLPGDISANSSVALSLGDGSTLPFQVDVKARHADGSLRHAIFSSALARLSANKPQTIILSKSAAVSKPVSTTNPNELLREGFKASVNLNIGGTVYSTSADQLLRAGKYTTWLDGPVATEWLISAPLKTAAGLEHPHLSARFAIRSYAGLNKARVDVTIENNWAYEPGPQNFTYDAEILVSEQSVYRKTAITHFHHARWRKVYWWGDAPQVDIKPDLAYLIASRAVPNYDTSIRISETGLKKLESRWAAANTEPMEDGIVVRAMGMAGGRGDIGPLPQWAAMYLLSGDLRAKNITLGVGDLAGSWPIHYRDKKTDKPVSLNDYPYMTLLGRPGDAINPVTRKSESFPSCGGDCKTSPFNYQPDTAHQPSLAYVPYLLTGDYYYLEELQFWADWNMLRSNPGYRGAQKGLLHPDEVRGQAWSMRTLGQVAYITPDDHPMKTYFLERIANNINWYNANYVQAKPNALGVLGASYKTGSSSVIYKTASGPRTGVAPWQDDFFTWSVGYLAELDFDNIKPLLKWKAQFPVGRMTTPGYCWVDGAVYAMSIRSSEKAPLFTTLAQAYQATFKETDGNSLINSAGSVYLEQPCGSQAQANWRTQQDIDKKSSRKPWAAGEMTGYASSVEGFPSNMQPALAVAVTSGIPGAETAWKIFYERTIKPNYQMAPQWAVVPRN